MKESDVSTPLIEKYTETLESNPKSRVFAPLAEAYRKLGMTKQALKILQQGIRYNPDYILGHLGIAHCYFDSGEYILAYNTLKPLIAGNRDNILLQRLYSDVCLKIGHNEEALETFKFLLFINPRDEYTAKKVKELEDSIYPAPGGRPEFVISEQPAQEDYFRVDNIKTSHDIDEFDEWVEVKLSPDEVVVTQSNNDQDFDNWSVQKEIKQEEVLVEEQEDEFFVDKEIKTNEDSKSSSMFTQTLVNLYCGQGHFAKAKEILEKIIELNPNDEAAKLKLAEVEEITSPKEVQRPAPAPAQVKVIKEENEDDGRKNLMSFFDTKIKNFKDEIEAEERALFESDEDEFEYEEESSAFEFDGEMLVEEPVISMVQEEITATPIDTSHLEEKLWSFHALLKQRAEQSMRHL